MNEQEGLIAAVPRVAKVSDLPSSHCSRIVSNIPEETFVLARILQATILILCTTGVLLSVPLWFWSPVLALVVVFGIVFSFSLTLAVQFTALRRINQADPAQLATRTQLIHAWWHETLVAARVFFWYQPFRYSKYADKLPAPHEGHGVQGVVLVHGFVCNRGVWAHWLPALVQRDIPYCTVNLAPLFCSIEDYVPILDAAVRRMEAATGMAPLIVCHSMGGLAVRAWLRHKNADDRVFQVVTIGTPHHGTLIGKHLPRIAWLLNGEQMRYSSPWLSALAQQEPVSRRRKFVCFYSNCDNIVAPTSTATLPDADNRFVDGVPHLALVFDQSVLAQTFRILNHNG